VCGIGIGGGAEIALARLFNGFVFQFSRWSDKAVEPTIDSSENTKGAPE